MGIYRLTENAKEDLRRIYRRGLREYDEAQADKYFNALFDRFERLLSSHFCIRPLTIFRKDTAAACAGWTVFTIAFRVTQST